MSQSNLSTRDSDNHTTERGVPVSRIRIDDLPVAENLTPEQEELIQGAGLKPFRPSIEALEARDMPALIAPGIDLTGNTLTFKSDTSHYASGATVSINSANQVVAQRGTGPAVFLDRSQVTRIVYEGGQSKDTFTNNTPIQSQFNSLNQGQGDRHVRFSMTGPSRLSNDAASGQTKINGDVVGKNIHPTLGLENLPANTAGMDLTMRDPDAGPEYGEGYVHMVLRNIPASTRQIVGSEGGGLEGLDSDGIRTFYIRPGTSSDSRTQTWLDVNGRVRQEYYGPNPPEMENQRGVSETHTYVWTLTAKDASGRTIGETQFRSEFGYESGTRT